MNVSKRAVIAVAVIGIAAVVYLGLGVHDYSKEVARAEASAREFIRRASAREDIRAWGIQSSEVEAMRGCTITSFRYRDVSMFEGESPRLVVHVGCGDRGFMFLLDAQPQHASERWKVSQLAYEN